MILENPKVTIYIVSHNYGKYLEGAIDSVLTQTIDNWELLLIDENSTDNTREIMEMYKGEERIRIYHTEGEGLPVACNLALREARGQYIIRLDGDDIFDENAILVLSNYLDRDPDTALVFPDYYLIDEFGEVYAEEKRQKLFQRNYLLDVPANGACTMIRRDILTDLGCYREDLGAQDGFDIWMKVIAANYKCANINLPLFYYRKHQRNLTNNIHFIQNARRQIKKDSTMESLECYRPIIAVIPCRRNFDFCLDLWKQELQGKSLLERNIERCLQSSLLDFIVVASDNPEVLNTMGIFSDSRLQFFERKKEDTLRTKKIVITLDKIVKRFDPELNGIITISYLHTPLVTIGTIEEAIFTLVMNDADSAVGVEELRDPLYMRTGHGLYPLNPRKWLSTDFDIVFRENNTALATKNRNICTGSLKGSKIVHFPVSNDECFLFNSQRNLEIARYLLKGH